MSSSRRHSGTALRSVLRRQSRQFQLFSLATELSSLLSISLPQLFQRTPVCLLASCSVLLHVKSAHRPRLTSLLFIIRRHRPIMKTMMILAYLHQLYHLLLILHVGPLLIILLLPPFSHLIIIILPYLPRSLILIAHPCLPQRPWPTSSSFPINMLKSALYVVFVSPAHK